METKRTLRQIASDIDSTWSNVNYSARPYLNAMYSCNGIDDMYGMDSAKSIVLYFLSNASAWRGADAKRIKAELKALIK